MIRWPTRALKASVGLHVVTGLTSLGWMTDPPGFAQNPIHFDDDHDVEKIVAGGGPQVVNTVGLTVGDVPDAAAQELGGGLSSINYPVFFDIYGEDRSTALNIGDDIVGILQGAVLSTSRYIPLYDFSLTPAPPASSALLTDQTCEARLIEAKWASGTQQAEWRRRWRIVTFTATVYFVGGTGDTS